MCSHMKCYSKLCAQAFRGCCPRVVDWMPFLWAQMSGQRGRSGMGLSPKGQGARSADTLDRSSGQQGVRMPPYLSPSFHTGLVVLLAVRCPFHGPRHYSTSCCHVNLWNFCSMHAVSSLGLATVAMWLRSASWLFTGTSLPS